MILVSACLAGAPTRWDGRACPEGRVLQLLARGSALPLCPEQLGGLPTPRPKASFERGDGRAVLEGRGRVLADGGEDLTEALLKGARAVLELAQRAGCRKAILREGSPSCGLRRIHTAGGEAPGKGVLTALLEREGFEVEAREP